MLSAYNLFSSIKQRTVSNYLLTLLTFPVSPAPQQNPLGLLPQGAGLTDLGLMVKALSKQHPPGSIQHRIL